MIVIVGWIVVLGAVLGGFTFAGGNVLALIQPAEFVSIGGAAMGALILMSPKKVLVDLVRGLVQCVKGTPYNKTAYEDMFKLLYSLLRVARRDGLMALEPHLRETSSSTIFTKFPNFTRNHHAMSFLTSAMTPIAEGTVKPDDLHGLLESDIKLVEDEHHATTSVLMKTADALPGFGIVAAVMGIVITMSAIDGPVEEIGEKVGAALVGTFLGILLSYGFVAPMVVRLEFINHAEVSFLQIIASVMPGFMGELAPKVALERARRGVASEYRPTQDELDEWLRQIDAS
ncbi:MAG: flagellar motor stator protein MotA [Thermoguttaceae bacterium]